MCTSEYIKFFRKIQEWEWYKDIPCFKLFTHCLIKANLENQMFQGKEIKAGSFVTSLKNLAYETGLTISQVRTAIRKLEMTHSIAIKSHRSNSVITINNWEQYQADDTQVSKGYAIKTEYPIPKKPKENNTNEYTHNTNTLIIRTFKKPTIEEIKQYCIERNNQIDAEKFYDYYESNGWKVGKNSMKNWKAAVRTWEKNKNDKCVKTENTTITFTPKLTFV